MGAESLRLVAFEEGDFDQLIAAVPDARFLLQWAGPKYTYPLNAAQLRKTLATTLGETPSSKVYKAVLPGAPEPVGHVQLRDIDPESGTCVLGRVLIFRDHRGRGLGKAMVALALDEAFAGLGLSRVSLRVVAFNVAAIATYERLGFIRSLPGPIQHRFEDETWEVLTMGLSRETCSPRGSG